MLKYIYVSGNSIVRVTKRDCKQLLVCIKTLNAIPRIKIRKPAIRKQTGSSELNLSLYFLKLSLCSFSIVVMLYYSAMVNALVVGSIYMKLNLFKLSKFINSHNCFLTFLKCYSTLRKEKYFLENIKILTLLS